MIVARVAIVADGLHREGRERRGGGAGRLAHGNVYRREQWTIQKQTFNIQVI